MIVPKKGDQIKKATIKECIHDVSLHNKEYPHPDIEIITKVIYSLV